MTVTRQTSQVLRQCGIATHTGAKHIWRAIQVERVTCGDAIVLWAAENPLLVAKAVMNTHVIGTVTVQIVGMHIIQVNGGLTIIAKHLARINMTKRCISTPPYYKNGA